MAVSNLVAMLLIVAMVMGIALAGIRLIQGVEWSMPSQARRHWRLPHFPESFRVF